MKKAFERLTRSIRRFEKKHSIVFQEFLQVLQNYMLKDAEPPEQEIVNRAHKQICILQRDLQIMMQKQIEVN